MGETLFDLTGQMLELKNMLCECTDDTELEQIINDSIESVEGALEVKAEGYVKVLRSIESQAETYAKEAEAFAKKAKTAQNRAESLKKALFNAMTEMNIPEIKTDLFKLKLVGNGGLQPLWVTEDISEIPEDFIRIKREADKGKIAEHLKTLPEDVELPWAHLEPRGKHLSIK